MFLVDDDEAELAGGSEHGAAGADHDLHLAGRHAPPVAAAFGVAEVAVHHRRFAAATLEAGDGLRRQADLRHQHQRLFALTHHLLDGPQIDFRLAAAGDAVQQERTEPALVQRRFQGRPGAHLVLVKCDRPLGRGRLLGGVRETVHAPGEASNQPFLHQRLDGTGAALDPSRQVAHLHRPPQLAQQFQSGGLLGGQVGRPRRAVDALYERPLFRAGLVAGAGRHHGVKHLTPSAKVVVGHPARQAHQVVVQQRLVVEDGGQFLDRPRRRRFSETDAVADRGTVAAAERRPDALADADRRLKVVADGVGKGVVQRPIKHDVGEQAGDRRGRRFVQAEQVALHGLGHDRLRLNDICTGGHCNIIQWAAWPRGR